MTRVSFLWHLHQPSYRTADGTSHAPWTVLHAGGSYRTLASAILEAGGLGQVVNVVPTLLDQLLAYRDGSVHDPVLESLTTRAGDLGESQRETLVEWGFHVTPRQLGRYPRLAELAARRPARGPRLAAAFGPGDLRDLQVLFVLAQAGEQAWRDERLAGLAARGRGFSTADHDDMTAWLGAQAGELVELWRALAARRGVEIATSPYAHPIMPLLVDTGVVEASWAPNPAPQVPAFRHPEDAAWQLAEGLATMRGQGFEIRGCWPPEGSVSETALGIYAGAGISWLVTDEGILERSLGRPLRSDGRAARELYRPWTLDGPSPALFFRDRELSDAIGFRYGRWDDEARAARALVDELRTVAGALGDDDVIVLALDGENPWLHYPEGGGPFLRELMTTLTENGGGLEPETLGDLAGTVRPGVLERLHPGSWINGTFATWIGHPEKSAGWRLLAEIRDAVGSTPQARPHSLLLAEASDWFWWLGDDNPTELAPLYDEIFRRHLADACRQAGIEPPAVLQRPLKATARHVTVPVSFGWPAPRADGRVGSYFEWCLANRVASGAGGSERSLSLWAGPDRLHLLLEAEQAVDRLVEDEALAIRLRSADGTEVEVGIDGSGCRGGAACAVGRVAEVTLPWSPAPGARLEVGLGDGPFVDDEVLVLEPLAVDEPAAGPRKG